MISSSQVILLTVHIGNYKLDCVSQINLTSIRHQQLLRGGMPVRVLVLSWSDDIDAVGAFKYMPGYRLTYVMGWLRPELRSVLTVSERSYRSHSFPREKYNLIKKDMSEIAGTWSLIWSMGRIPEQIISALVETKEGMTRPGQSQRHRSGSTYRVCDMKTWGKTSHILGVPRMECRS